MSAAPLSNLAIAQAATLQPIAAIAHNKLGIDALELDPYGHVKAKLTWPLIVRQQTQPRGKLVLVTAISPTPAGEGKTTTTVGLGDALNALGKRAMICLREPALGPCFGIKGGAAGGGRSQVVPMEDINLHFTGDFHAIAAAHNLLAAVLDNHLQQGNALNIDPRRVVWRRTVDMNDRALRQIVIGMGGPIDGVPRESGFDIVPASEVMAVLCLSQSIADLKERLGKMLVGYTYTRQPVYARDLKVAGAMTALLRDALRPNLVQTLEGNPALVHGGPFANIAHGCSSVVATTTALGLADIVVTEAGFGADLGAEKFLQLKCRQAGLWPSAAVLVATVRALKYQGGVPVPELGEERMAQLQAGMANLGRHLDNLSQRFGLPVVVGINRFASDRPEELQAVVDYVASRGAKAVVCSHFADGSAGALALGEEIVRLLDQPAPQPQFLYAPELPLWDKIRAVATQLYGATDATAEASVKKQCADIDRNFGPLPVCIAKTQYSFSSEASRLGAPTGHELAVREVRVSLGAGFAVALTGTLTTMPGLPKIPASDGIDVDDEGRVTGLF
jgi:formate--tetrahydrofolate ligase